MFSPLTRHICREAQTRPSAPSCLRGRLIYSVTIAFLLALYLSPHTPAFEQKKPTFHLTGLSIKAVDWRARTAKTELLIAIENPGPAFKVKDLSYRLKLNEKQAAEGKFDKDIEVPAESRATLELPCTVDLSAMPGVAWTVVAGGFDVHYELETEFTVPLFALLSPRIKSSIAGDLSLAQTVAGWTARIKERIANQ